MVSDSLQPHGVEPARLLYPWILQARNTGMGSHSLLQGIFPTQGWKLRLLHCRQITHCLSHQEALKSHTPRFCLPSHPESLQLTLTHSRLRPRHRLPAVQASCAASEALATSAAE